MRTTTIVAVLSLSLLSPASAFEPLFDAHVDYQVGTAPISVIAADLDEDGKPDLAVAIDNSDSVSILKNNGDGTFASAVSYGVGTNPYCVCVADFDGDGKPDLAVANFTSSSGSGKVSILKNNGNGIFSAAVSYEAGYTPSFVTAADFDGDGEPDLAITDFYRDSVSILINAGNGTFASAVRYGVGSLPYSLFAADFDGDGKPDLAVANHDDSTVSILKNNGDGTFAGAVSYGVGSHPKSVIVADLDGDGKPDLAVANWESNTVSILNNNGDGTFAGAVSYAVGLRPESVSAADFDGDGKPDLAVADGPNTVSVLKNNGDGTFSNAGEYQTGSGPKSVFAADLDVDGKPDLAVANMSSNTVSILINIHATPAEVTELHQPKLPQSFVLSQNHPNPFNPTTQIRFSLPTQSDVRLVVYNLAGQVVKVLVDDRLRSGSYLVDWDGTDQAKRRVSSGVYLYRLDAGQYSESRKMVLLK
jgi:hypothetical protein